MNSLNNPLMCALDFLAARQSADGGWGYLAGKQSFPEPTCYALLALADAPDKRSREERALTWFARHLAPSGTVALEGDQIGPDNWGTILAFFTLRRLGLGADLSERYLRHLLRSRGNQLDRASTAPLRLNPDLRTWSWVMGTASWVEPTAYALIALKSQNMGRHDRVKEGEAFLFDRACYDGGWNYGNKEVLGVRLEPMTTATAYALLALQDYSGNHGMIKRSLAYLERELTEHQSALALALGVLCLDVYHRPTGKLIASLLARQEADGSWRSNAHLTALAALALKSAVEKRNIFKI